MSEVTSPFVEIDPNEIDRLFTTPAPDLKREDWISYIRIVREETRRRREAIEAGVKPKKIAPAKPKISGEAVQIIDDIGF